MKTYEDIPYELENGDFVSLTFTAEFELEDHGIGSYEYWGAKCRDIQWVSVCQEVYDIYANDESGEDIIDSLDKKQRSSILDFCNEYADRNPPNC
jgi:hypothetical protein